MISNVSPSTLSYEDTFNTLQYANRAKNIKTKVRANEINIVSHVSEYKEIIADLRKEVEEWKTKCSQFESQLEEEGRQRQMEMDEKIGLSPVSLRSRQSTQAGASSSSQLPLLSRTVSMGLQTPRNSKVEKKVITWASEIADLAHDRRNVQTHLEEANATIAELTETKARLQEAMVLKKDSDLPEDISVGASEEEEMNDTESAEIEGEATMTTPLKRGNARRNLESVYLAKREYDLVSRKLEENLAERNILLQRLGRNAESSKRIQSEMSKVTPRAEDASLFHQVKLELVINVLEISNFNRAMQEAQLSHALAMANEKYSRTLELADYLRTALSDFGYEESIDIINKFDMVHAPSEEPLECAHLPSPFAQSLASAGQGSLRSPTANYAGNGAFSSAEEVPSTPSRFDLGAADSDSISSSRNSRSTANTSRSGMSTVRFQGIAESASESSTVSSPMAARRAVRVPLSATTAAAAKLPTATQANASNRVSATSKIAAKVIPSRTTYNAVTSIRSTGTTSAKKTTTATSVVRPRQSMIPTAPASATKEKNRNASVTPTSAGNNLISQAKRTSALGGAQRVATGFTRSNATGASGAASAVSRPVPNGSDSKKNGSTEIVSRYKHDPVVAKALATFKPAFEPQERSTPPSASAISSITSAASRHVKVSSTGSASSTTSNGRFNGEQVAPSTPSTPRMHSTPQSNHHVASDTPADGNSGAQNSIGVFRMEPNPLAMLLQHSASNPATNSFTASASSSSSGSSTPTIPAGQISVYSRPPTAGMVYSPSSPSQSISTSPLFSISSGNIVHTHTRSNSGPSSPMSPIAKPLRV